MGDVILGIGLTLGSIILYLLYLLFWKIFKLEKTLSEFVAFIICAGGLLGLITNAFDHRLFQRSFNIYLLALVIFSLEIIFSILIIRKKNYALLLISFPLLLQSLDLSLDSFHYRCQTMVSVLIKEYPGKIWDIEPGSYLAYYNLIPPGEKLFPIGVNLIPIGLIIYFTIRYKRNLKDTSHNKV